MTDVPPLGDEALVVTYTVDIDGIAREGHSAWIRVGNRVAAVNLAGFKASRGTFEQLAQDEAHCLASGGCWEGTATLMAKS